MQTVSNISTESAGLELTDPLENVSGDSLRRGVILDCVGKILSTGRLRGGRTALVEVDGEELPAVLDAALLNVVAVLRDEAARVRLGADEDGHGPFSLGGVEKRDSSVLRI